MDHNIIFTPHVGGASDNSLKNMGFDSIHNVLAVLKGSPLDMDSVLNKEVLDIA